MAALSGGMGAPHRPVLVEEAIDFLGVERGGLFIDCTVGTGGHSEAILESSRQTQVLAIDRDTEALGYAKRRLAGFGDRFRPVHANFQDIRNIVAGEGMQEISGIVVDLGVSSLQFDSPIRGFSFRFDSPLDMRMDQLSDDATAAQLLARLPEEEIARIIFEYGEEKRSRRIARSIVKRREEGQPVATTKELANLVAGVVGSRRFRHIHPATRTFQALRIAVNKELEGLAEFVEAAVDVLQPDGRFVAISFHSLEDRIIKRELRRLSGFCQCPPNVPICSCGSRRAVELLTKRPIVPDLDAIAENPRARSAKLRACRKLRASA